jgi:spore coat protein U-like protein
MNKLKKLLFISSVSLLSTTNNTLPASAYTASGSITASGSVVGTCTVSASNMAFSTLAQDANTTQTSTVTATCSDGVTWTVTNAAASNDLILTGRSTITAANTIALPLTVVSGSANATLGTFVLNGTGNLTGTSAGSAQTGTITGIVAAVAGKTAGTYGATVNLTITYN